MDSSITAAGSALRQGDPLGALKRVALRDDPADLALRGIAMAQLGDLGRPQELLQRAALGFGPRYTLSRARCLTAEAEVALAARDLAWAPRALTEALRTFAAHGDRENAAHARLLQIRRRLRHARARRRARPARGRRRPGRLRDRAAPGARRAGARGPRRRAGGGGAVGHRGALRGGRAGWTDPRPAGGAPRRRRRGAV